MENETIKQLTASLRDTDNKLQSLGQFCVAQQKALELLGTVVAQHQSEIEKLSGNPAAVN